MQMVTEQLTPATQCSSVQTPHLPTLRILSVTASKQAEMQAMRTSGTGMCRYSMLGRSALSTSSKTLMTVLMRLPARTLPCV